MLEKKIKSFIERLDTTKNSIGSEKANNFKMSFFDIFKVNNFKKEIEMLRGKVSSIESYLTPEMKDAIALENKIKSLQEQVSDLESSINSKIAEISELERALEQKKSVLIETDEKILLQEFGLYEPKYDFMHVDQYKEELQKIRQKQKDMIKSGIAATGNTDWTVNGSNAEGRKMVKDMQKLLLRAFNSECDELVEKVKYNTFETACKRISASYDAISKLGKIMNVAISKRYYALKIDELTVALEYRQKKQEEKERQKELKEQMREEAKLQKEIEAERKKMEKEQNHYENALSNIIEQLKTANENQIANLTAKKEEIENKLKEIDKSMQEVDYRAANQKAGYVYIISNIGAFGENVYKIGMTRRLDPTERVSELGDASVPFNFDIHAMIFSEDAPALEAALHKAFENKKLNMVNQRREFFRVTLDEIKDTVKKNFDKTVEFINDAEAEQYRISEKMRRQL